MIGSLLVNDESGRSFRIGKVSVIKNKEIHLAVGTVITYKFTGTTKKVLPKCQYFTYISAVLKT